MKVKDMVHEMMKELLEKHDYKVDRETLLRWLL